LRPRARVHPRAATAVRLQLSPLRLMARRARAPARARRQRSPSTVRTPCVPARLLQTPALVPHLAVWTKKRRAPIKPRAMGAVIVTMAPATRLVALPLTGVGVPTATTVPSDLATAHPAARALRHRARAPLHATGVHMSARSPAHLRISVHARGRESGRIRARIRRWRRLLAFSRPSRSSWDLS